MNVNKEDLKYIIDEYKDKLAAGFINDIYEDWFMNDKGRTFIQSLINASYSPRQILDNLHRISGTGLVNINLFKDIEFPEKFRTFDMQGIKKVLGSSFEGCNVNKLINTEDIQIIIDDAFKNSSLEEANLIYAQSLETSSFENCMSLKHMVLGKRLKHIGKRAFYDCANLETIFYEGSEAEWRLIYKGNEAFVACDPDVIFWNN